MKYKSFWFNKVTTWKTITLQDSITSNIDERKNSKKNSSTNKLYKSIEKGD